MIYRLGFILLALGAIALGLVVGTLNADPVAVDLLWVQLEWPLGLVILVALITGFAIGLLLLWMMTVLPLRLRLRKLSHTGARQAEKALESTDG